MKKQNYIWLFLLSLTFVFLGCTNDYSQGMDCYEAEEYEKALNYFNNVDESDKYFEESQKMIAKIEDILEEQRVDQTRQDSIRAIELVRRDSIRAVYRARQDNISLQRQIYRELMQKQESVIKQADKRYPNQNDWEKHAKYMEELDKVGEQAIMDSYDISRDSLLRIVTKGSRNNW